MNTALLGLAAPILFGLVTGAVILWDRLREPHRDIHRPVAVVDQRTYRDARRRVERLAAEADWRRAYAGAAAICMWLASERHFGGSRRRQRLTADLEMWTARRAEYNPATECGDQLADGWGGGRR
jgi:hypothetical protein